jgi:hypothetical protein
MVEASTKSMWNSTTHCLLICTASKSALGRGCVKTPTLNLRVEFLSQFRRCGNRLHPRLLLREDDSENNSARPWLKRVFTQPGSKADLTALNCDFRYTLDSGHRLPAWACPKGANTGSQMPARRNVKRSEFQCEEAGVPRSSSLQQNASQPLRLRNHNSVDRRGIF